MLCRTLGLVALYNVPIYRYFTTLYWVWYLYHSYVGELTWCKIFWWFYRSPNSSSRNFFYFFERVQPLFWTTIPTFLGCWALIAPAFFTCFQQDDRVILLNVVTHVEIDISPFQMALQDVWTMLPQGVCSHVPPFESLMVRLYPQL